MGLTERLSNIRDLRPALEPLRERDARVLREQIEVLTRLEARGEDLANAFE